VTPVFVDSLLLLLFAATSAPDHAELIRARCAAYFPRSYLLRDDCASQYAAAIARFGPVVAKIVPGTAEAAIARECDRRFTDRHGRNWLLLESCYHQELDAQRRANPPR
jgi:hypothetical protein